MHNYQLLDEIRVGDKTMTGIVDYVTTKYVIFYDFSMNADPLIIKVLLMWRMYFSHIRFSVFKELYFMSLNIGHPVMINKKSITCGSQYQRNKVKKKTERVLPKNAVVVDFIKNTDNH